MCIRDRSFDQDGYLILRNLFSKEEITVLQTEAARIAKLDTEGIIKENKTSTPKIMLRMHDPESPTSSPAYVVAARLPRVLGAAQQVLRTRDLYLHHSKINIKGAIEGSVWPWHQDFGHWYREGCLSPDMLSIGIALTPMNQDNGSLNFIRCSHKFGRIDHVPTGHSNSADPEYVTEALKRHEVVPCILNPGAVSYTHLTLPTKA